MNEEPGCSFYSIHIANFLASDQRLLPFNPFVYCLNPKMTANYRRSFIGMDKTDPKDAFLLADFARVGRINTQPWRGSQFLALQRLRHRLHIVEATSREKGYFQAEDTAMSKAGNRYLRYYLIEAANSVRHHIPENNYFYHKKFTEVKTHQHKRALALTSRKLIRLIYGLLDKNQLYSQMKVVSTT